MHQTADLELGESQPETHVFATAEGQPEMGVPAVLLATEAETVGIEALRIGPPLGHAVGVDRIDRDHRTFGDGEAVVLEVADRDARNRRERWVQAQRFVDAVGQGLQTVLVLETHHGFTERQALLADALLPFWVERQQVGERGQGAGGGVVGRHHQENRVVDDLLIVQPLPVFALGLAQPAQGVSAGVGPTRGEQARERLGQLALAFEALLEFESGNWKSQDRHGGGHHGFEAAVQPGRLGSDLHPDKDVEGHFERELLVGREGEDPIALGDPIRDGVLDPRVHAAAVLGQGCGSEGLAQDAPVAAVVRAVSKQQAAAEDASHDELPGPFRGEDPVAVQQQEAIGFGPEQ